MIKKVALIGALAVFVPVAGLLGFAATQPDTFRIERSVTVQAPAQAIYPLVSDFHQWQAWSPFEKLDPQMKKTFSGAEHGKGAVYGWSGSGHAGVGRMEIVEATAPSHLAIQLDFSQPFEAHNTSEFSFASEGAATRVTWAMEGRNNFVSKVMCVFVDMDQMLGKDFESGLASLKAIAEKQSARAL